MNNRPLFIGNEVQFTAIDSEKDAQTLAGWTTSPEFVHHHFENFFRPYTVFEIKKLFKEKLKKADESRQNYYFMIRDLKEERLMGMLHIGWISLSNQSSGFNIFFADQRDFEKYTDEVLAMSLRYAFMELSLHRLSVSIPSYDEDRIALYERAGFLRETQRREASFHEGKFYDLIIYAILRQEWKKQQVEVINER